MKSLFKNFNENFWKSTKNITWYDKQGVMKLDEFRVVTLTFDCRGHSDQYNGYEVEILNKNSGTIVKRYFWLKEHLTMIQKNEGDEQCHVWLYRGSLDWYISRPKDTKEFVKAVMDWINEFK